MGIMIKSSKNKSHMILNIIEASPQNKRNIVSITHGLIKQIKISLMIIVKKIQL